MGKKRKKRTARAFLALFLAAILSASLLHGMGAEAAAKPKPKINKKYTCVMFNKMKGKEPGILFEDYDPYFKYRDYDYASQISIENPVPNGKITKLKSSKPGVLKVSSIGGPYIQPLPKKPGKSKVTFQYAGKKFSTVVTVKKYENPCKAYKVGKKDYAKKFNKSPMYGVKNYGTGEAKISITPKKGWKIIGLAAGSGENDGAIQIKNNTTVSMDNYNVQRVRTLFKNKKTGEVVPLCLYYGAQKNGNT